MSALQFLAPEFIQEKRLCWLRSPLFLVRNGKNTSYYFDDNEFNKIRDTVKGDISRIKGLGTLSAYDAHNSMFTEEYQRMDVLSPETDSISLLLSLMGEEVEPRKDFVFENVDFSEIKE